MIKVRSQNKKLLVDCVGFSLEETDHDFEPNFCIRGIVSTTGQPATLGYYYSEAQAQSILDEIGITEGSLFEMPPKSY